MKKTMFARAVSMLLSAAILFTLFSMQAFAAQKVIWQEAAEGVYDANIPGMILTYKDELVYGGMNLYTGEMSKSKASVDIAYYSGTIAARDIIDLGETDFDKVDTIPDKIESQQQNASPGHVYIVSTYKGEYAKVLIKKVLASGITIKYAILKESSTDNPKTPPSQGIINKDDPLSDDSNALILNRFDDIGSTADIQEGNNVLVTWGPITNSSDESYDIYRSDNGAKFEKLNDLRLSEREYTDEDCQVGHYYLYRIISFDENDNVLKAYPLVKVTISKKQINITPQIGSSIAKVNGAEVKLDGSPSLTNKKVLIPLNSLKPLLNAKIVWDSNAKKALINCQNTELVLQLNSSTALMNRKKVAMDAPLQMINGKLMLSANLLNSAFNLKVRYTGSSKTIVITGGVNQKESVPATNTTGLEYAFKTFQLWVNGTVYNFGSTLYVSSGTVPKSTLTVNRDGTYVWNSSYDSKVIKGSWTKNSDGSLNLFHAQEGKTWKVVQSNGKTEDIYVMDGSTWYCGKAVTVKYNG